MHLQRWSTCLMLGGLLAFTGCGDDDDDTPMGVEPPEVITTVKLTFTPPSGPALTIQADDPDGDGTQFQLSFTPSELLLARNVSYATTVELANTTLPAGQQDEPNEEVTQEQNEHQFFFYGTNINGPASNVANAPFTHAYSDTDTNPTPLPVGFSNTVTTIDGPWAVSPAGGFVVLLRHLPPLQNQAQKVAGLAGQIQANNNTIPSNFPGETDIAIDFPIGIQ